MRNIQMNKKKHIVIIANNIDGGVGTFLSQIHTLTENTPTMTMSLLSLKKDRHTSFPSFSYIAFSPHLSKYSYYNIGLAESSQIIKETIWLKQELSHLKPDIIISFDVHASLLACFLKKFFFPKTKLVISNRNNVRHVMSEKVSFPAKIVLRLVCGYFFRHADKIVCVSKGLAQDFKQFFMLKQPVYAILDGIDIQKARLLGTYSIDRKNRIFFTKGKQTIISIGRLEVQKDFETLIKATQLVRKKIPTIQLLIIGDGSQKTKLNHLIKKLRLENSVFLLGWRGNVYPYLRRATTFVLSSKYEGFGYVLIEAMSQGTPVISTDSPFGPAEILSSGKYGILTPVKNPKVMADCILQILQNKKVQRYYATQSQKRASYFSQQAMLSHYKSLLNGL